MKRAKEILTSTKKFHINLGLDRIRAILNLLDNPQDNYKIIHIAGTNGKGSTSKIFNQILLEENKKTGLFTSPHLYSYCERIKVNNIDISEYVFDRLTNEINDLALENNIELTEFELICAVAFYYFYIKKVEYVVLEVGLGGLYDSTNIINNPMLEIITTIDFDHTQKLGDTIEKIAIQKAGIIKNNSFVIVNSDNLGLETIKKVAQTRKTRLIEAKPIEIIFENNHNYALINNEKVEFNLLGVHQGKNLALALEGIKCLDFEANFENIKHALKNVQWGARLEFRKEKKLLIDGAHNPSGIKVLKEFLEDRHKNDKKIIIFGCLENKEYNLMLDALFELENCEFYFYEFNYPNSLKYEKLDKYKQEKMKKITNFDELKNIIENNKNLKILCGSLYMIGQLGNKI